MDKTCQQLKFLSHPPAAPTYLISPLQVELTIINDMYDSCKPTIISAMNLLNTDYSFDGHVNSNTHQKRSLLVFHRKDLCEAKHKIASVFKFSDDVFRSDTPPHTKLSVTADQVLPDLCLQ